ncbi:MAG: MurT ligase domain-containing protein [Propionibacteriaceae bacterium]|nr:MurT ligase domain-containing protein [Propionibacteriaceae bacterium]
MNRLGLLVGKLALLAMKLRRGGSSLPGFLANRIAPNLLSAIRYPKLVIAVTGTNGKTSTANLIAEIFRANGAVVAHNTRGANMMSGVTTAILAKTDLSLRLRADVAVLEIDEANVPLVFRQLRPHYLLINNFFRDQLERYGELETIIAKVSGSVQENQVLVVNGNDPLSTKAALDHPENRTVFFGVERSTESTTAESEARESKWCPRCNEHLSYDYYHYSQIGKYQCQHCGFATPRLTAEAVAVNLSERRFTLGGQEYRTGYDNLYFLFNIVGAIALCQDAGVAPEVIAPAVAAFQIGEGRMERFTVGEAETFLNLIKNPAGLDQTISHILAQPHDRFSVFMALNNQAADSIDTSWIWDAALEKLDTDRLATFVCSGDRAYDLAVRLENAGVATDKIVVHTSVDEGLRHLRDHTAGQPYVLTNYTPLQPVRRVLSSFPENRS